MILAAVLLCFLALARSQVANVCPSFENIRPCSCQSLQGVVLAISCDGLKSVKQLVQATTNMKGYSFYTFTIEKSNIGVLPSDIFANMEISSLVIKKSNLTKLGNSRNQPPFLGLENSLQSIVIQNSLLDSDMPLASLSLSHLKRLNSLHLENNIVPTVANNWFENGPYNLRSLYITNSTTSLLGSHAFEALEILEFFVLSQNLLTKITRDMLPMPASSLRTIDLSKNKLSSLPDDIFTKMPSLNQLILHSNSFTTIKEVVFAPIWSQLNYCYFNGNPIICNSELKWIFKYRLPENFAGYCVNPPKLRNKDFRNIVLSDLEE